MTRKAIPAPEPLKSPATQPEGRPIRLPTREQAHRELARRSLRHFARLVQPRLAAAPFQPTYYRALDAFARGTVRRLIVTMPPQHGKSTGSSVLLPAYLLGLDPRLRIGLASYNFSLAARFNRRIQQLIDTPLYGRLFPETRIKSPGAGPSPRGVRRPAPPVRTQAEFDLAGQEGGLLAVGREGALTGNPVDVFILDDLYKDALEANSPLVRDNAWEWYNSVVKSRLHDRSRELIVFTRWHEEDLIGRIAAHEEVVPLTDPAQLEAPPSAGWLHLHFEAIKSGPPTPADPRREGEALWPGRQSIELLEAKRRLDPRWFETLYQGRPAAPEGLLYGGGFATYDSLPAEILKRGNYTDTADTGEDYLCSVCYAVGRDGLVYLTDVLYTCEPMEASEPLVAQMLLDTGTATARIESNNGGRGFARAVSRLAPRVQVEWFHQGRNKEARILSNAPTVLRMVRLPRGWERRWEAFHGDLCTYRRLFRANRRHDAPDVLTGIVETETDGPRSKKIRAIGFS